LSTILSRSPEELGLFFVKVQIHRSSDERNLIFVTPTALRKRDMRGRPPKRKKGAYTAAERMRRYRRRLKRARPSAKTIAKQERRAEREAALAAATVKAAQALGAVFYGVLYVENAELLLVGTRGNVPCPAPGTQFPYKIRVGRPARSPRFSPR